MTDEQTTETQPGTSLQERIVVPQRRLGRKPHKSTMHRLQFSEFFGRFAKLPKKTNYWTRKRAIERRTFGNNQMGNCTRAKQAYAAKRMERIETRREPEITDEEIIRVYQEMSIRRYGGGDNGAYEDDALSDWRNPDTTFRDTDGNPLTIDAFLALNAKNQTELKAGLAFSGPKGIAICIALPWAFSSVHRWDIPEGQQLTGDFEPYSWGGHSMWAIDYDEEDLVVDDTWAEGPRRISWRAAAVYLDEAHVILDSITARRKKADAKERKALGNVVDAVNAISAIQIAA